MNLKFTVLLWVMISLPVYACTCNKNDIQTEFKVSELIISAKIVSKILIEIPTGYIDYPTSQILYRYEVQIEKVYKGEPKPYDTIYVYSGQGNGDCGFHFEIGKTYLIYLNSQIQYSSEKNVIGKYFYTDICSRTKIMDSKEDSELQNYSKKYYRKQQR